MMFTIKIMSREEIEEMGKSPFNGRTALISIADDINSFAKLENSVKYHHRADFVDVDLNEIDMYTSCVNSAQRESAKKAVVDSAITDEHAANIAEFVAYVSDKIDLLVCQCEYGQSRSAAVAAAVSEFYFGNGIWIFVNKDYYPNKYVFHKVYAALIKQNGGKNVKNK